MQWFDSYGKPLVTTTTNSVLRIVRTLYYYSKTYYIPCIHILWNLAYIEPALFHNNQHYVCRENLLTDGASFLILFQAPAAAKQ